MIRTKLWVMGLLGTVVMSGAEMTAPAAGAGAVEDWQAMRFGMFIHWGPVSLKGTEIGWSRGREVPSADYDQLYRSFDPQQFDAEEWVRIAREAGMRYLVITSKHHDGFCLWPSAFTDYDIGNTPFGRDVLRELSDACRAQGIRFCTYYSLCDWYHPDYPLGSPGGKQAKDTHDMPRYYQYIKDQTRELATRYGPLGLMWFDGEWEKPWTREYGNELYRYLKELQPDLVINNRVSKGRQGMSGTTVQSSENAGDYDTPEQRVGGFNRDRPWETCMTICRQWAWKPDDTMKSTAECVQTLLQVVGGDGNFLFNVGPMPDGRIEPRQVERLQEIGDWLKQYGVGVYGTRGGPFMPGAWGASTCRDDRIYLYIMQWPSQGPLRLPPIHLVVTACHTRTGGTATFAQDAHGLRIDLAETNRSPIATVLELTVGGQALEIAPVEVSLHGSPIPIQGASASNTYREMAEYRADRVIDGDAGTRWATDSGTRSAWLELDLGTARTVDTIVIREAYAGRVKAFEVLAMVEGRWQTVHAGSTLGENVTLSLNPVATSRIRIQILEASEGPTLSECRLFLSTADPHIPAPG